MAEIVLQVENLWKQYRLGLLGTNTIKEDLTRFWANLRGKEDPTLKIGEVNDRENITGEYVWALQDINFEVERGEVVGIIGKNGAGKSTLLKILSRVTAPTKGQVKVNGRIASLLEVGTGFHPELSGRENIFLNGAILGMSKQEIRFKFDEIVEFSGIGKYIDTPVKRYSSGMYVRLAFAVAAHLEPEILIVDEVLAVGDAEFQKKCLGKMKEVAGEGRTVLFVSHNMSAVQRLCTKAILLQNGVIQSSGAVENTISEYLTINKGNRIDFNDPKIRVGPNHFSRFTEIILIDKQGKTVNEFFMGNFLQIKFSFALSEDVQNLEIGISLRSMMEENLITLIGVWEGLKINYEKGMHQVTCTIPQLLLFPGQYFITAWIKRTGQGIDEQIPYAAYFTVIGTDVTGFNPNFDIYPNMGVFHKSNWAVITS